MGFRNLAALLILLLASAGMALAQETTGSIRGRVADAQGLGVPGATVTATGPQGVKSTISETDGRFTIPFLTPGPYDVKTELQGFKSSQQTVTVSVGQEVDVPIKLEVGGVTDVVNVVGAVRVVDTSTTTIGSVLSSDTLAQIPVGRRVADALYLVPGVSGSNTLGRMNPSISGGSGLENQYVVDGANVTNTGYGGLGSYSLTFGSLGNATPYDFIKEIQVKTGGYEAEFGQATGGVVNIVTKSGSNDFRGSMFGYTQPTQLEGAWKTFVSTNGSVSTVHSAVNDGGAEGGGPVIKDRLFFFGAIDPSFQKKQLSAPPGFALVSLGTVDQERRTISYAAKATLQVTSSHRVDASFFGDPSHGNNGPQRPSSLLGQDISAYSAIDYGGHQQTVRYSGVMNSHFLLEGSFARSKNATLELPSIDTWRVTDQTVTPTRITGGIGSYQQDDRSKNDQWNLKVTNIVGGHQIKYGVEFDDVDYSQANQRTGPTFTLQNGQQTATGAAITVVTDPVFGKIYKVTRANLNSGKDTTQKYVNFFVQDSWKVGNRLTINPGVRYEQEKLAGLIVTDWQLKNNWAPRLGAAYDATGDGRTKVYGNYGIFYARIPNDLAARALSADASIAGDYFDAGLTRPIPNGVLAGGKTVHFSIAGVGADVIDPNTKLSYINEVVLGVDRELRTNTTLGVRYVFRNMPRVVEDIANCPMLAYDLPATSSACGSVDYILTNPSSATPVNPAAIAINPIFASVKFDDPVHVYHAVEFTLNRRGANWTAMASYRWSRLRGNFEGFYRDDNGQSDPGISALYDFPTNDPTYTSIGGKAPLSYPGDIRFLGASDGILPLDRPNQVKLYGNYMFDNGLNLGLNVRLNDGKPLTPMAINPNLNYQNSGEIPTAPRGSGIQTIDGFMTRTPFESQVDFQASWSAKIGGNRRITFIGDVFNLFNQKRTINYDQNVQLTGGTADPDFGKPVQTINTAFGNPPQFQTPISLHLGVRFEF